MCYVFQATDGMDWERLALLRRPQNQCSPSPGTYLSSMLLRYNYDNEDVDYPSDSWGCGDADDDNGDNQSPWGARERHDRRPPVGFPGNTVHHLFFRSGRNTTTTLRMRNIGQGIDADNNHGGNE